jgi:hypothetical protein
MLVGAAQSALHAPLIGITWLACFTVANGIGTTLWLRRDRLRPYPAIQMLLLVLAISGLGALVSFDVLRPADVRLDLTSENGRSLPGVMGGGYRHQVYLGLLVGLPSGLIWAHLMERSATAARARAQGGC